MGETEGGRDWVIEAASHHTDTSAFRPRAPQQLVGSVHSSGLPTEKVLGKKKKKKNLTGDSLKLTISQGVTQFINKAS